MFCKECGNQLKDGVAFCNQCGTKIETNAAEATQIKNDLVTGNMSGGNTSRNTSNANNRSVSNNGKIPRETYIGKAYTFDYYFGLNLRSFRISRRAVGFDEDNLLYCKGFSRTQIPYNSIEKIYDEVKTSRYAIFCFVFSIIIAILCLVLEGVAYAVIAAVIALLAILWRNYRQISIITNNMQVFKINVVLNNREMDQFLTYLKNETRNE